MIIEINDFILYQAQGSCSTIFECELPLLTAEGCHGLCHCTTCSAITPSSCSPCFGTLRLAVSASHLYFSLALLKLWHISLSAPKQRNSSVISPFRFRKALCGTSIERTLKIPFVSHLKSSYY